MKWNTNESQNKNTSSIHLKQNPRCSYYVKKLIKINMQTAISCKTGYFIIKSQQNQSNFKIQIWFVYPDAAEKSLHIDTGQRSIKIFKASQKLLFLLLRKYLHRILHSTRALLHYFQTSIGMAVANIVLYISSFFIKFYLSSAIT